MNLKPIFRLLFLNMAISLNVIVARGVTKKDVRISDMKAIIFILT